MPPLDNQTKALIIAGLVALFALPRPSMETIKGWLEKMKPSVSGSSSVSFPSLAVAALSIFYLITDNNAVPSPDPVTPTVTDRLDKCAADYRDLLSEVWNSYSSEYNRMRTDEERLEYLNKAQQAAYTAAYDAYIKDATAAASNPSTASSLSQKLKDRTF